MVIPSNLMQDRYWGSLLMIFTEHPKLKIYLKPQYIDIEERSVKSKPLKMVARPWSQSEKFMLDLALHLFNERNKVNLSDIDYLDPANKQLALKAIMRRFVY